MAAVKLTVEQMQEAVDLVREYGTITEAAKAAGINRQTLHSRVAAAKLHGIEVQSEIPKGLPFERYWATWQKEIGMARDRYAGPAKPKARTGRLKLLVIPDLHAPFHDAPAVASMLERERDIDI